MSKIEIDDETLSMLDHVRGKYDSAKVGPIWSRDNKVRLLIKDAYEKQQAQPKMDYPPKDLPPDPLAYLYRDGSRFGSLSGTYLHNWGPQPQYILKSEAEEVAQDSLDALHDLVDAVAELAHGPITVTAEAPIKGGGTYKMTATIDYGLREKS